MATVFPRFWCGLGCSVLLFGCLDGFTTSPSSDKAGVPRNTWEGEWSAGTDARVIVDPTGHFDATLITSRMEFGPGREHCDRKHLIGDLSEAALNGSETEFNLEGEYRDYRNTFGEPDAVQYFLTLRMDRENAQLIMRYRTNRLEKEYRLIRVTE